MPEKKLSIRIKRVEMNGRFYNHFVEESWKEIKKILSQYDIKLSKNSVKFCNDNYIIKKNDFSDEATIFFKGNIVSKIGLSGETEGRMVIYDYLKTLFTEK